MIGAKLGSWVIDKELGRGGMGRVYLAHHEFGVGQAAVKVLSAELAAESGFQHRFQREIEALRQLDHPNIVRFLEAGCQDGHHYYAMEYVEGRSLEELLHERGQLPWAEVLDAALQVCAALKHAHDRGVIHRDLKPPNLLRTPAGVVKLTDFGIAKVFATGQLTATGGIVGTAEYLSPEQAAGKPVTKRSDLYSLGVVLYTLVTGRTPFEGEGFVDLLHKHRFAQFDRPQKLVPELPYELDEVICQLLEKDPARRPADGLVLQRQLDSIRRKLERKAHATSAAVPHGPTVADHRAQLDSPRDREGPATLMSRLVRDELHQQNRGGPVAQFFNRPWVLVPLFLLCVGVLVWTFWFREDEDEPARPQSAAPSEAERIFRLGQRHEREGDVGAAQRDWQDVVAIFGGVESERFWVGRARQGLKQLREADNPQRWASVRAALKRARKLSNQARKLARDDPDEAAAKRREARKIWDAVENRYRNDPSARAVLRELRRDRGQ
jgi:serine/threonine-protein kinase